MDRNFQNDVDTKSNKREPFQIKYPTTTTPIIDRTQLTMDRASEMIRVVDAYIKQRQLHKLPSIPKKHWFTLSKTSRPSRKSNVDWYRWRNIAWKQTRLRRHKYMQSTSHRV
ncbi:hypothetical protein RF11_12567 [Thelohanellus kitauei]|uniref:Uncharacterized protein n=1 Tax=Thelohanellus kitauei TaxID=669202 RepID=A0A0C2IBC9_THEKT|nr:hypothetical protein RF11_12567 [Thelohanellus kitauei]